MITILIIIASLIFLAAVYYSFKLSKETNHEKYWLFLAIGLFILAVHHWMMIPEILTNISENTKGIIEQLSSITGATFIVYAVYGLYTSMRKINKKLK